MKFTFGNAVWPVHAFRPQLNLRARGRSIRQLSGPPLRKPGLTLFYNRGAHAVLFYVLAFAGRSSLRLNLRAKRANVSRTITMSPELMSPMKLRRRLKVYLKRGPDVCGACSRRFGSEAKKLKFAGNNSTKEKTSQFLYRRKPDGTGIQAHASCPLTTQCSSNRRCRRMSTDRKLPDVSKTGSAP